LQGKRFLMRVRHILVSLAALCVIGATAPAAFASYQDVIRECYNTGQLPAGKYTRHELLQARSHLPSDIREYSDCEDLINSALAAGKRSSGGGGGGTGGGSAPAPAPNPALTTPSGATAGSQDDLNALSKAQQQAGPPQVKVADSKLSPSTGGVIRAAKNTDVNSLPTPLLASLIALAAMALLGGTSVLRQHWPRIRRASPLRLFRR
jgi:hypothetical protein